MEQEQDSNTEIKALEKELEELDAKKKKLALLQKLNAQKQQVQRQINAEQFKKDHPIQAGIGLSAVGAGSAIGKGLYNFVFNPNRPEYEAKRKAREAEAKKAKEASA